jgi:hypothetical protein
MIEIGGRLGLEIAPTDIGVAGELSKEERVAEKSDQSSESDKWPRTKSGRAEESMVVSQRSCPANLSYTMPGQFLFAKSSQTRCLADPFRFLSLAGSSRGMINSLGGSAYESWSSGGTVRAGHGINRGW